MTDNWEEYFSKLQLEPYLVFVFTASTRSSTDLHIILLIHNTACFVGSVVRSNPPCSNIFSKFPCLCWTTVHQSFNYQMLQWSPSIRKIPVALQFGRTVEMGDQTIHERIVCFQGTTTAARCSIMKPLFQRYEVAVMPSGFSRLLLILPHWHISPSLVLFQIIKLNDCAMRAGKGIEKKSF